MECPRCDAPVSLEHSSVGLEWVLRHRGQSIRIAARLKVDPWRDVPSYWATATRGVAP